MFVLIYVNMVCVRTHVCAPNIIYLYGVEVGSVRFESVAICWGVHDSQPNLGNKSSNKLADKPQFNNVDSLLF